MGLVVAHVLVQLDLAVDGDRARAFAAPLLRGPPAVTGLLVRWREGHLLGPDIGHIPVSNLYEVFVLFALITALFYLYYERRYATRALGGFVLLVLVGVGAWSLGGPSALASGAGARESRVAVLDKVLPALLVLAGLAVLVLVVLTGDSGSRAVWG